MMRKVLYFFMLGGFISVCNSARILTVFPSPFPSHQSVFRPLIHELARRGHEVVFITTDPAPKDNSPTNLIEIDIRDISYDFRNNYPVRVTGSADDIHDQVDQFFDMFAKLFELQMQNADIQNLINDKDRNFDVILIEACVRPALVFGHIFKAPVITISSLGSVTLFTEYLGLPTHPILYPNTLHQRLSNLTLWDRAIEINKHYTFEKMLQVKEEKENKMLKRCFGDHVPRLSELKKNVAMLMINLHHIWEGNRPVPPNVIYLGGMHLSINDTENLPTELKSYLDSSTHGVIYMSLGTLVLPSRLENVKIIIKAFSKLPYDILLKWDEDYLPESPNNVKIMKWMPQKELLHHPNVKLFITQGGIQSTDEAITAGVPVIGVPILGDQWYNVEKYVELKIGLKIDLETVTEKKLLDAVNTVIEDTRYNMETLRVLMYDLPQTSLDRAVWWTEYILRHGRSPHLLPPAAHMSLWEYYEMNLLLVFLTPLAILLIATVVGGIKVCNMFSRNVDTKLKVN